MWLESSLRGAAIGTFEMVGIRPTVECELKSPYDGVHYLSW